MLNLSVISGIIIAAVAGGLAGFCYGFGAVALIMLGQFGTALMMLGESDV